MPSCGVKSTTANELTDSLVLTVEEKNNGEYAPLTPNEIDYEMETFPHSNQVIAFNYITQAGLGCVSKFDISA